MGPQVGGEGGLDKGTAREKRMDLRTCWRKTPGLPVGLKMGVQGEEGPKFGAWLSRVAGGALPWDRKVISFPNPISAATRDSSK